MKKYEIEVSFNIREMGDWRTAKTESVTLIGTLEMLDSLDMGEALDSTFHHAVAQAMDRDGDREAAIEAWMDSDEPKTYNQVREELGLERLD